MEQDQEDCIFCEIVAGSIPSTQVYTDEQVVAFRDIDPQAPVHVIVASRQHIPDINSPAAENGVLLAAFVHAAHEVARKEGITDSGYRLVWNYGQDGGQAVPHLHLHVLGGRALGWPPG